MIATLHVETQILAVCLTMPGQAQEVAMIIKKPDTFSTPQNQQVYAVMLDLVKNGHETDVVTVGNELQAKHGFLRGEPEAWFEFLMGLFPEADTFTGNIAKICFWLINEAARRTLIKLMGRTLTDLQMPSTDPLITLSKVREQLDAMESRLGELSEAPFSQALNEAVEMAEKASQSGNPITGVATGLYALDSFSKGLHGQTLEIWAARPAMGKTALLCQTAYNIAHLDKVPVAIFSLEMSRIQMARRMLAIDSNTKNAQVLSGVDGWGQPIDISKLYDSSGKMGVSPIYVYDTIFSLDHILAKSTQLVLNQGVKVIYVDYIGLVETEDRDDRARVSRASRQLKLLGKKLNVAVVVLAQLSRKVEERPNKRPMMSDLRDSGALEQDADGIMFLYRPGYYSARDENGDPIDMNLLNLIKAKNRNGSTHNDQESIAMHYDQSTNRIRAYN